MKKASKAINLSQNLNLIWLNEIVRLELNYGTRDANKAKKTIKSNIEMATSRVLNFFDLTALGIGCSLGIGIFLLTGNVTKNVAGPAAVVSVAVAGIAAILAGLCFAELGVRFLKVDSVYAYCYSCNNESVAFILGWALILEYITGIASVTKGIIVFIDALANNKISDFLIEIVPMEFLTVSSYFDFVSLGFVIIFMIFLGSGLKENRLLRNVFTISSAILMVVIITAAAFKADIKNWNIAESLEDGIKGGFAPNGFLGVIKGAAIVFYGFIGFGTIGISESEVRRRHLPFAIFSTLLILLSMYFGVIATLTLMSPYFTHNIHAAVPFAFEQVDWVGLKWVVAVGAFFGFQTSLFGSLYPLPKIIYGMANDSLLFHFLGNQHTKTEVPIAAVVAGGSLAAIAAGVFTFEQLINLTVNVTLFVYTIIAVNVILLSYTSNDLKEVELSEDCTNSLVEKGKVSLKGVIGKCFNFKDSFPTNLTIKIIIGNIILFCVSSVGLSVVFIYFSEPLFEFAVAAAFPSCVFVCIMLFALISMATQSKSRKEYPWRVPLNPLTPCLSIFLNTLLMVSFEASTWIEFSIWMALGIIPHLIWNWLKCCKSQVGESSLYQINKMNAIKLNESIWKINSEKKSFYDGAINPVFCGDSESKFEDAKIVAENNKIKNTALLLKQAEIIQTADVLVEEKTEPLRNSYQVEYIDINNADNGKKVEMPEEMTLENEKIQWECVAEIHTEVEDFQESVVLEIVENSYNFLANVGEDLEKDERHINKSELNLLVSEEFEVKNDRNIKDSNTDEKNSSLPLNDQTPKNNSDDLKGRENGNILTFKQELLNAVQNGLKNKKNASSIQKENPGVKKSPQRTENINVQNNSQSDSSSLEDNKSEETMININVESMNKTDNSEIMNDISNEALSESLDSDKEKPKPDEQNKVKVFKEKLNELLKNQINYNSSLSKNIFISKSDQKGADIETLTNDIDNETNFYKNMKTLNKSQIKGQLEFLLSKGPPKRSLLSNSFKINNLDDNNEFKKINNINIGEQNDVSKGSASEQSSMEGVENKK